MHKRKRARDDNYYRRPLSQDAKKGLLIVLLLLATSLILLSAFGLAGVAGIYIDRYMALGFGWTRLVVALSLLIVALGFIFPNSERLTKWTYTGLLLFFLSGNALINLLTIKGGAITPKLLAENGGYFGLILERQGFTMLGFWGAFVVLTALLAVSLVLIFHSSFDDLRDLISRLKEAKYAREERRHEENDSEGEDDDSETVNDENLASPAHKRFSIGGGQTHKEETLITKKQKRIELSLDLLDSRPLQPDSGDIGRNSEIIIRTFENFGISTEVVDVSVGPTITQYAIRPADGIKLSRIVGLQSDLALALAAHPIRIEAPIPGKSLVGIEVPNKSIATVSLRSILESKSFKHRDSELSVALGMDVSGKAWVGGLERMPHLLVAGATGSGKSVCLNAMIISLLYQHGPDMLKFILIDPKRVELPAYTGIPHLLVPPITKAEEAINALKWTVREMERRLDVLSANNVRNIASYNKKSTEQMPYIVVIMDELADLMSTSARDVEALVVRIAQMARAVGIHLILATQRPSVDIITGTIKANIPARIAFAVASQTDSRTILDYSGADKLLGRGDMLYTCAELPKARRMQGAFVSDQEIKNIVDALKKENAPDYNYDVLESHKRGGTAFSDGEDSDPLLKDAVEAVLQAGKASTSLLQRRLKVGYSRAARMIDLMEERGIIGVQQGAKPREILIASMDELTDEPPTINNEPPDITEEAEEEYDEDNESNDEPVDEDEDN
ncbi:MAG: DNA translocase FtsK 4TM domain-containing protein, partial [Patescibacteria group bacterium]